MRLEVDRAEVNRTVEVDQVATGDSDGERCAVSFYGKQLLKHVCAAWGADVVLDDVCHIGHDIVARAADALEGLTTHTIGVGAGDGAERAWGGLRDLSGELPKMLGRRHDEVLLV